MVIIARVWLLSVGLLLAIVALTFILDAVVAVGRLDATDWEAFKITAEADAGDQPTVLFNHWKRWEVDPSVKASNYAALYLGTWVNWWSLVFLTVLFTFASLVVVSLSQMHDAPGPVKVTVSEEPPEPEPTEEDGILPMLVALRKDVTALRNDFRDLRIDLRVTQGKNR